MNTANTKVLTVLLIALAIALDLRSARALEPQTLFKEALIKGNFPISNC